MVRLRLLLAWLLMAALPLQGFAATSMLSCGIGTLQAQAIGASQTSSHSHQVQETMHHEHSSDDHASSGSHGKATTDMKQGVPDSGHKCSICTACCNSVAIVELDLVITASPAPQTKLAEPFVLILARATPVPDKPPRA